MKTKKTTGLRFECTQCGKCCTRRFGYEHVYVDEHDVRAMAALLGSSVENFRREHTFVDEYGWTQVRFAEDACPFLDVATNHCQVYAARPVQCRTFPFWRDMVDARGWTDDARTLCEGVGRGEVQPRARVEASMTEMEASD